MDCLTAFYVCVCARALAISICCFYLSSFRFCPSALFSSVFDMLAACVSTFYEGRRRGLGWPIMVIPVEGAALA